jgi:DNA-binding transcriptional LysR family regulator
MKLLDLLFERSTRRVADTTSRRKLLSRMGSLMVAGAALPAAATGSHQQGAGRHRPEGR